MAIDCPAPEAVAFVAAAVVTVAPLAVEVLVPAGAVSHHVEILLLLLQDSYADMRDEYEAICDASVYEIGELIQSEHWV